MNNSTISDQEFQTFEVESSSLDAAGRWDELERRCKKLLKQHISQDIRRAKIMVSLIRSYMRQGKFQEALDKSKDAIELAHQNNDALCLSTMLDLRAEILCFCGDFPQALRILALAEQYLREGKIDNLYMQANLAHTRAMVYKEAGWWKKATESLRQTIEIWDFFGYRDQWSLAVAEYGRVLLQQVEIEGVDEELLQKASWELAIPRLLSFSKGNLSFAIQNLIDLFMLRTILATSQRNRDELYKVKKEFGQLMTEYEDFFSKNQSHHVKWSVGVCRNDRAWIDIAQPDSLLVKEILNAQLEYLNGLLEKAPYVSIFWQEKAALHLCRARYNLENPVSATYEAANCMEKRMEIFRSITENYTDTQLRAGWLNSKNSILQDLASVAFFALTTNLPEVAARMISLVQYLRMRSQQDLVRSWKYINQTSKEQAEIEKILTGIRHLPLWLEAAKQQETALLNKVSSEPNDKYPDYSRLLENPKQLEYELEALKLELERRTQEMTLLSMQSVQVESESSYDISKFQSNLNQEEFILDYYVGASKFYVGVIGCDYLQVLQLPLENMQQIHEVAKQLSPHSEGSLAEKMRKCSRWLFPENLVNLLIDKQAQRLYIVASGPLWRIPFSWLDAKGKLALERWQICLVPSARLAGQNEELKEPLNAFVIGHRGDNASDYVEPDFEQNVPILNADRLFQEEATPQQVLSQVLPNANLIHFICHGECDSISPLTSCLQLEPDEEHKDGHLMLYEFLGVHLQATLINLAACSTAKSEAISFPESLGHVLLGAGVRFVVASLWTAYASECVQFDYDFYYALTKKSSDPILAFNHAQREQVKRLPCSSNHNDYGSLSDEDFARFANFVLLSARTPVSSNGTKSSAKAER